MHKAYIFLFMISILNVATAGADELEIASGAYVEQRMSTTVSITGDQEVAGKKNFTVSPIVPTPTLPAE